MIFVPVVEHAPTLTVCLSLTNFKEPISQKDLWNFWFDKSLWKLSWVLHKIVGLAELTLVSEGWS